MVVIDGVTSGYSPVRAAMAECGRVDGASAAVDIFASAVDFQCEYTARIVSMAAYCVLAAFCRSESNHSRATFCGAVT
jgi:hypothetical protein